MLQVDGIEASYGESNVLFGVSLSVKEGEAIGLLGRNGMGKTTTIRVVMGMLKPQYGTVRFAGQDLSGLASYRAARAGIGLVPEGRQIFPNLSVRENLLVSAANRSQVKDAWNLNRIFELFPRLRERWANMGNQLSGGEQQMLAIGRALMTNPKLLILDEATEGLAPLIRTEIWRVLARIKSMGQAILIVDKHIDALTRLADRHYIIERGKIVWEGTSSDLKSSSAVQRQYLGV